jgi:hypothetical protein
MEKWDREFLITEEKVIENRLLFMIFEHEEN